MDNATTTPASPDVAPLTSPEAAAPAPVVMTAAPATTRGSMGTTLAVVLVLAVALVAALYLWGERVAKETVPATQNASTTIEVNITP